MSDTICSKTGRMNGATMGITYWDSYLLGSGKRMENGFTWDKHCESFSHIVHLFPILILAGTWGN